MSEEENERKAKTVFFAALDLEDESERERYLDEACAGDTDLLRRVKNLLSASSQARQFLSGPAADLAAPFAKPSDEEAADQGDSTTRIADREQTSAESFHADTVIGSAEFVGPYQIGRLLGEGGFGVVFEAEQKEPIRRRVALKVIKAGMDTRDVIARFEIERQALALMQHPNIAQVLDAGKTPNGRPFFVMELVVGEPITRFCDKEKLSVGQRLELFCSVCRAVQHAHLKGIVHRDLKPSNILVASIDGTPRVKIIDFGIAKATSPEFDGSALNTAIGQLIGTPAYMSPEQASPGEVDIDTRSDVYSLGVLLYELLTDSTPIDPDLVDFSNYDQVRHHVVDVSPPKPSTRLEAMPVQRSASVATSRQSDSRRLRKEFGGDLDWIVMKSLEKERSRRYESASAFAQDIERYLRSEPVSASAPSLTYLLRKFVGRHRQLVVMGSVACILLIAATIVSTWQAIRATDAEEKATQLADEAKIQTGIADRETARAEAQRIEAERERERWQRENYRSLLRLASIQAAGDADLRARVPDLLWEIPPEQRNWEWGYLVANCDAIEAWQISTGHTRFTSVDASLDGALIATAGADRHLKVWNTKTLASVWMQELPDIPVSIAFDPTGRYLAVSQGNVEAEPPPILFQIYDAKSGEKVYECSDPYPAKLIYHPDGQRLFVSIGFKGMIRLRSYRVSDWTLENETEPPVAYDSMFIDSEGSFVGLKWRFTVAPSNAQSFPLYTTRELAPAGSIPAAVNHLWSRGAACASSARGDVVFAIGNEVFRHELSEASARTRLATLESPVRALERDPRSDRVFAADTEGRIRVINSDGATRTYRHASPVTHIEILPLGRFVSAAANGTLKCWDLARPRELKTNRSLEPSPSSSTVARFSADGRRLLYQWWNRSFHYVFDMESLTHRVFNLPEPPLYTKLTRLFSTPRFHPRTHDLVASFEDELSFFNLSSADNPPKQSRSIPIPDVRYMAMDASGKRLLASTGDKGLVLFDLEAEKRLPIAKPDLRGSVDLSREGHRAVLSSSAGLVLWDVDQAETLLERPEQLPGIVALHPTGRVLAVAPSGSAHIDLWQESGEYVAKLEGHAGGTFSLRFTPDGERLFSSGADHTVRIWDWHLGKEVLSVSGTHHAVFSFDLSPDGRTLAYTGHNPSLRVARALPFHLQRGPEFYAAVEELFLFAARPVPRKKYMATIESYSDAPLELAQTSRGRSSKSIVPPRATLRSYVLPDDRFRMSRPAQTQTSAELLSEFSTRDANARTKEFSFRVDGLIVRDFEWAELLGDQHRRRGEIPQSLAQYRVAVEGRVAKESSKESPESLARIDVLFNKMLISLQPGSEESLKTLRWAIDTWSKLAENKRSAARSIALRALSHTQGQLVRQVRVRSLDAAEEEAKRCIAYWKAMASRESTNTLVAAGLSEAQGSLKQLETRASELER